MLVRCFSFQLLKLPCITLCGSLLNELVWHTIYCMLWSFIVNNLLRYVTDIMLFIDLNLLQFVYMCFNHISVDVGFYMWISHAFYTIIFIAILIVFTKPYMNAYRIIYLFMFKESALMKSCTDINNIIYSELNLYIWNDIFKPFLWLINKTYLLFNTYSTLNSFNPRRWMVDTFGLFWLMTVL